MSTNSKKPNVLNVNVQSPSLQDKAPIESKLNDLREFFSKKLAEFENRIMERIGDLAAELKNLRYEVNSTNVRLNVAEKNLVDVCSNVHDLQTKFEKLDNASISSDFIIHNVPADADVDVVVKSVCNKLGCVTVLPVRAFRVKARNGNNKLKSAPIIVKLYSADERIKLLKALAQYRKKHKKQLSFSDVDLSGDGYLSIFECLTATNRNLMSVALQHKAKNELTAVFSMRGQVFVRKRADEEAVKVTDLDDLKAMVGASGN